MIYITAPKFPKWDRYSQLLEGSRLPRRRAGKSEVRHGDLYLAGLRLTLRGMTTLLTVLDVVVLLLLIALLLRVVGGFGSAVLSAFVGAFVILFSVISLGAYSGMLGGTSGALQVIFLLILIAMAAVIASSWKSQARPS